MSNFCLISDIRTAWAHTRPLPGGGEVYYFSLGPASAYEIEGAEVEDFAAIIVSMAIESGCEFYRIRDAFNAGFHCDRQGLPVPSIGKAVKNILLTDLWSLRLCRYIRDHITVNINKDKAVWPFYQTVFF